MKSVSRLLMSVLVSMSFTVIALGQATEQTFTILGAYGNMGDVHPYTEASLDGGTTWQEAYLTGWHPWGFVPGTNSWLNFDPDDEVGIGTRTPYRIRFVVPADFTDPSMVFTLKADNRAIIWINDTFIDSIDGANAPNVPDEVVEQALNSGLNEIRLILVDWGGIVGLNYRIDVTMTSAEDLSDALLTTDEADDFVYPLVVDIKPQDDNNRVNPRNRGVIPVAVLSIGDFDALTIDVGSLSFGPGGTGAAHGGHSEDVDGDGDLDLMLHFSTRGSGVSAGDTELCLEGLTSDGDPVAGCDAISTTGGGRRGKVTVEGAAPDQVALRQNYPNPFNPTTSIGYEIANAGLVRLTVYNLAGQEVVQLVNELQEAGRYQVDFDGSNLSNGLYFYILEANGQRSINRMTLMK